MTAIIVLLIVLGVVLIADYGVRVKRYKPLRDAARRISVDIHSNYP